MQKPAAEQVGTADKECHQTAAEASVCYAECAGTVQKAVPEHGSGICVDAGEQQDLQCAGHAVCEEPSSNVQSISLESNGLAAAEKVAGDASPAAAARAAGTPVSISLVVPDKLADGTGPEPVGQVAAAEPTVTSGVNDVCSTSDNADRLAIGACEPATQLAPSPGSKLQGNSSSQQRTVKFANLSPDSSDALPPLMERPRSVSSGEGSNRTRNSLPRRSRSLLPPGSTSNGQLSEAVLAKQVEILRSNKMGKLRQRRGGLDSSFQALQDALEQNERPMSHVNTRVSKVLSASIACWYCEMSKAVQ